MFYLIPSLFDYVLYGVFFIAGFRLAELGTNAVTASAPMAVWGIVYALSAPLVGRLTTSENALKLLRISGLGTAVCALLFMFFQGVWGMLILVGVMGIVSAFYCIPFQMCANAGNEGRTPERAAGLYTFAWSIGTAAGTFGFGSLPGNAGFAVNALIGILMIFFAGMGRSGTKEKAPETALPEQPNAPDRMVPVWIFGTVGAFAMAVASALLPLRGAELKNGLFLTGAALAVLRLVQGLTALGLIWGCKRLSAVQLLFLALLTGAGGMVCLGFSSVIGLLFAGTFLFGLCGGIFYFSLVYYALGNVQKGARYLGVNEMILGITGIAGPFAGGAAVQELGIDTVFIICAGVLFLGGAAAAGIVCFQNKKFSQDKVC